MTFAVGVGVVGDSTSATNIAAAKSRRKIPTLKHRADMVMPRLAQVAYAGQQLECADVRHQAAYFFQPVYWTAEFTRDPRAKTFLSRDSPMVSSKLLL